MPDAIKALIEASGVLDLAIVARALKPDSPEARGGMWVAACGVAEHYPAALAALASAPAEEPKLCGGCRFARLGVEGWQTCENKNSPSYGAIFPLTFGCVNWKQAEKGGAENGG